MEGFIHRKNVALFKRKLAEAKDEGTRTLIKLIAEEEVKPSPPPKIP